MFKYFQFSEFDSPDEPGSALKYMDTIVIHVLDVAREEAGIPFIINSGYRTETYNKKVGGSPTSSHLKGLAADIAYNSLEDAVRIIAALARAGFYRIGLYPNQNFIHVDDDDSKPVAYWVTE